MDISDSFDQYNQQQARVLLDAEETNALRSDLDQRVREVIDTLSDQDQTMDDFISVAVSVAVESFTAGRCYEEQFNSSETFPLDLPRELLQEFMMFLYQRRNR